MEISSADVFKIPIGLCYLSPDSNEGLFINHLHFLENKIDASKYRVQFYRYFNLPKVDWFSGSITSESSCRRQKASGLLYLISFNDFMKHNLLANCSGNTLYLV